MYIALNFYGPLHIEIKRHPNIINGAKHFFRAMQLFTGLSQKEQSYAKKHFEINSFMAHFESIGLCAIYDNDKNIRKWALEKIRAAYLSSDNSTVRKFIKPTNLNWNAKHYIDLYDPKVSNTVPPLLQDYTKSSQGLKLLEKHVITGRELPILEIKCHTTLTGRSYICMYF